MPTTPVITFGGIKLEPLYEPERSLIVVFGVKPSTTIAKGTVVGELTATPGVVAPYASGNVDGSQNPIGLMQYDVISDSSGNVFLGGQTGGGEWGEKSFGAPVYVTGVYSTKDLVGLDAGAVTKLGRFLSGVLSDGVITIG